MPAFVQDLRYAFRQFKRPPGFFGVAVLVIAVAIAANPQIFTLVDVLLLRPLPVRDPENLIQLFEIRPRMPPSPYFDYGFSKQLAASTSTLFDVAAKRELVLPLEHAEITERSYVHFVTADFFSELGVRPVLGRQLGSGEDCGMT
jgi:putative ABC transport system permease protein